MTDANDKVTSTLVSSLVTDMVPILTIGVFYTMDLPMASSFEDDIHDKDSSTLTSSIVTDMAPIILTDNTFVTMDLPMILATALSFLKSVCSLVEPFSRVDLSGIL